jgi:hypothetical protein
MSKKHFNVYNWYMRGDESANIHTSNIINSTEDTNTNNFYKRGGANINNFYTRYTNKRGGADTDVDTTSETVNADIMATMTPESTTDTVPSDTDTVPPSTDTVPPTTDTVSPTTTKVSDSIATTTPPITDINASNYTKMTPPTPAVSRINLATIPMGATLYHASENISQFNDTLINIGTSSLFAFFTTDKNNAMSKIKNCAVEKGFPGYIHVFKVKQNITKILMLDPNDISLHHIEDKFVDKSVPENQKLISSLENKFCRDTSASSGVKLDGIGFIIPKSTCMSCDINSMPQEYALCNPQEFLTYDSTLSCVSIGVVTTYNFKGNPITGTSMPGQDPSTSTGTGTGTNISGQDLTTDTSTPSQDSSIPEIIPNV